MEHKNDREPLVSIVIPSFNRAYCLERTINSVIEQSYSNWEIILIDDGSTDSTNELINNRFGNEKRLKYFRQQNKGVAAARNNGLDRAQGKYIALLDSDDIWKPWKLELQITCLEALPEVGMIWTEMEALNPDGTIKHPRYLSVMYSAYDLFSFNDLFSKNKLVAELIQNTDQRYQNVRVYWDDIFSKMIMGNLVHTSTVVLRQDRLKKVKGFNENLKYSGEDYDFHLRTCFYGQVAYIDIPSIQYQTGLPDQLTQPEYNYYMAFNFLQTIENAFNNYGEKIKLPRSMIKNLWWHAYSWVGEAALNNGDRITAKRYLFRSLKYKLWQPRTVQLLFLAFLPASLANQLVFMYKKIKNQFLNHDT